MTRMRLGLVLILVGLALMVVASFLIWPNGSFPIHIGRVGGSIVHPRIKEIGT